MLYSKGKTFSSPPFDESQAAATWLSLFLPTYSDLSGF
jgi:hypothetical protein